MAAEPIPVYVFACPDPLSDRAFAIARTSSPFPMNRTTAWFTVIYLVSPSSRPESACDHQLTRSHLSQHSANVIAPDPIREKKLMK